MRFSDALARSINASRHAEVDDGDFHANGERVLIGGCR